MMKFNLLTIFFLILAACTSTNDNREINEEEIKVGTVEFKELESGSWVMTGNVINVNDHEIEGNVEVVLFNKNDKAISEFTTQVNQGNPIVPGDSGVFEYTADKSIFAGATRYHVKFVPEE